MQEYEEQMPECPHCGFPAEEVQNQKKHFPQALSPETILMGRYILGCVERTDGFSNTYVAWDALLEKKVSVREYLPGGCAERKDGEVISKLPQQSGINCFEYGRGAFEEESDKLIRNQDIEGIIPVFRRFREKGTSFRVSEYSFHDTLEEILERDSTILPDQAECLMTGLCGTIDELHERGIYHWDLTPSCIYVDDEWKGFVADFGFAKTQVSRLLLESTLGSSEYMAPELSETDEADGSADLYSLGMIGKKLFQKAGNLPFLKRSQIRKALNRASSQNASKRPDSAKQIADAIQEKR